MNYVGKQLRVKGLSACANNATLLAPLSFEIRKGSWLSIIGPNGAGKSTLLKALAGIIPSEGEGICWGDLRIDALPHRQRACYMAYVPQRFEAQLPFSVEQFLRLALYAENSPAGDARVARAAQLFRLERFLPRSIQQLSVGELQRVQLAAAFVQGSEILLLDEPSSALDPFEEVQMVEALCRLIREEQRTVILVSHNLSAALTFSDSVLLLNQGQACYQGAPEGLLSGEMLQEVFKQPFLIEKRDQQQLVLPAYGRGTETTNARDR